MKKLNNKILLAILVVLVAVFVLSRMFRSPRLEANLRAELVAVDTAKVTSVRIATGGDDTKEIKLSKTGNDWVVTKGNKQYKTESSTVKSLLGALVSIEPQRMVSRKKEKWETYKVDEAGTHVSVWQNDDRLADFYVGKTGFNQSAGGYQGGFNGAYTYVRLTDEEEVYTVDGFLESTFNRNADDFRDRAFLRINKNDVRKITFKYPADSGFVLAQRDSSWYIGQARADSTAVQNFLSQLSFKNLSAFADDFVASASPAASIVVDGTAGQLATIDAWKKTDEEWVLRSSLQNDVLFSSTSSSVMKDLFINQNRLTQNSLP